ncbi:MAG: type II toxin-antitoxin system RelE/ParE family toxin [Microcystaceae cyanobacterium]
MAKIIWTTQALIDVESIGDYIARDAPSIAQIVVDQILNSVERLENFPHSGRVVPEIEQDNIREIILNRYRIVYRFSENEVKILTVFHSSKLLSLSNLLDNN